MECDFAENVKRALDLWNASAINLDEFRAIHARLVRAHDVTGEKKSLDVAARPDLRGLGRAAFFQELARRVREDEIAFEASAARGVWS